MIGYIRRHQQWMWAIVGVVTIVSFIIFGPTTSTRLKGMQGGGGGNFGSIAGHRITQDQLISALHEIALDYFLQNQQWPDMNSPEITKDAYLRLFTIERQKEFGIQITTAGVARHMREMFVPEASLDVIEEKVLKPQGLTLDDLGRLVRHKMGIEQLMLATGTSGALVTPAEAEAAYRLEHRDIHAQMVYFSVSNYMGSVPVSPELITNFYAKQMANYRLPDRVVVSYVKFNVTNYMAEAEKTLTNLNDLVEANVGRMGTNLYHGTKNLEESKVAIKSDIVRQTALKAASKAANLFAVELSKVTPVAAGAFPALAAKYSLPVQTAGPFGREFGPEDIVSPMPPEFTKSAFTRSADEPFSGAIYGNDGAFVLALQKQLPSENPPLKSIEAKVTSDFRYSMAASMTEEAAKKFEGQLNIGLASGKKFSEVCAATGVHPETLPPYSLSTPALPDKIEDRVDIRLLKQMGFSTPPGHASPLAGAKDGGFLLFVDKITPGNESEIKAELPLLVRRMSQSRLNDAFNQWFNTQIHQEPELLASLQKLMEGGKTRSAAPARRAKS